MTRNGTFCYCGDGFEVAEDGHSCIDYDECAVYGTCSQTCMNTYGSYGCSCTEGYIMQSDRKSCKAKIEPTDRPPVLLIVSSEGIAATYLNGTTVPTQNSLHSNGALTLDFNYDEESVCWVTAVESTSQLRCAKMTKLKGFSEEREIRTAQNLHNVEQMAIDWLSGNFYFVDRISDRIFVCNQNEDVCVTLIDLDLHNPKGIALDPLVGKLFFTDYGNAAKVERCNMDGTNRMRIVDFKTEQPTAIALDLVKKLVYWADVYLDYIEVVDYDGKNRHTVIQGENVKYLYGLTVFEDYLYASSYDISRGSKVDILKINRFNSTVLVNLTTMENARSIHVYHKLTQPTDLDNVEGISVDWIGNNLYWTNDGHRKTISVARIEKASQTRKTLLEGDMSHPRGIVVDPLNGWMYWTDWEEDEVNDSIGRIEKAWMDGSNRQNFVTSKMLWPNGLALDYANSKLYWVLFSEVENESDNACRVNYGGCSTLCLAIPGGRVCACADNQHMENNNVTCSNNHSCPADQFKCLNNRCIPKRWLCDGTNDCGNNEDESNFTCSDDDCGDGSDEAGCVRSCSNIQFQCSSGRCIPDHWACDGDNDCGDFSDETNATCTGEVFYPSSSFAL
ncbi:UNVERIFIED_CONTAM: hypothetical protein FKN15_029887 [Acipenser sinensis]